MKPDDFKKLKDKAIESILNEYFPDDNQSRIALKNT
jgi:hypothetical protein